MTLTRIYNNKPAGKFDKATIEQWIKEDAIFNGQPVKDWQTTEAEPSDTLFAPIWDGKQWIEGATTEQLQQQAIASARTNIKEAYNVHEQAGTDYYNSYRADLILAIETKDITQQQALAIDDALRPSLIMLRTGDWMTCQWKLATSINPAQLVPPAPDWYNKAMQDVSQYIQENYEG